MFECTPQTYCPHSPIRRHKNDVVKFIMKPTGRSLPTLSFLVTESWDKISRWHLYKITCGPSRHLVFESWQRPSMDQRNFATMNTINYWTDLMWFDTRHFCRYSIQLKCDSELVKSEKCPVLTLGKYHFVPPCFASSTRQDETNWVENIQVFIRELIIIIISTHTWWRQVENNLGVKEIVTENLT